MSLTLTTSASITRTLLGLDELNLNDHVNYSLAAGIMGGQVTWERNEVSSPWVDGELTVSRRKRNVQENIVVNVYGASYAGLQARMQSLIAAFTQDNFAIYFGISGMGRGYKCFAADYQVSWDTARMKALNVPITFMVPRLPNPISGV